MWKEGCPGLVVVVAMTAMVSKLGSAEDGFDGVGSANGEENNLFTPQ